MINTAVFILVRRKKNQTPFLQVGLIAFQVKTCLFSLGIILISDRNHGHFEINAPSCRIAKEESKHLKTFGTYISFNKPDSKTVGKFLVYKKSGYKYKWPCGHIWRIFGDLQWNNLWLNYNPNKYCFLKFRWVTDT